MYKNPVGPKKNLIFFFIDKSRDLFKFVSVLLSASVERVGVSSMRDFSGRIAKNPEVLKKSKNTV